MARNPGPYQLSVGEGEEEDPSTLKPQRKAKKSRTKPIIFVIAGVDISSMLESLS